MQFSMHHINAILADVLLVVILQMTGITLDVNIKLQLAGLAGSILAVRTIDGELKGLDFLKVAFSGMVLANFAGLFYCEWQEIPLQTFKALFVIFTFGFCSDIILRSIRIAGNTAAKEVPTLVKAGFDKIKAFFFK